VTLRARLVWMMLAVLLPTAALFVWIVASTYQREMASAHQQLRETTRALSLVVDRELDKRGAIARTLASSQSIREEDFRAFYEHAKTATQATGNWIVLVDHDDQLLNTAVPFGTPLPKRHWQPDRPLATGDGLEVSNLRIGPVTGKPILAVFAAERAFTPTRYNVGVVFTPGALQSIMVEQRLPEGWVAAVLDREQTLVARSPDPLDWVGKKAQPALADALASGTEGFIESVPLDGVPMLAFYSRSPGHGWAFVIGVPRQILAHAARRAAWESAAAAALLAVFGVGLASWAARHIRLPIERLEQAARQLERDEVPDWPPTGLAEADAVGAALRRAGMQAALEVTERQQALDELRAAEESQRLLVRLNDATRGLRDPVQVQWEIVRRVGQHFGVSRCAYAEIDTTRQRMTIARDHVDGVRSIAGSHPLQDFGPALLAELSLGRTQAVSDVHEDARCAVPESMAAFDAVDVRALLCVPLVKEGRFVALLMLQHRAPRPFSAGEAALLEQVAERVWFAVENARAEAELSQAHRRKDEFLATLAHELRNPLAPITNALEILRLKDPGDAETRWTRDVIERQVRQMTRLVDDLLDVARITRGKIHLRRERVALAAVVHGAVEAARPFIAASGHSLEVSLPPSPIWLDADPTRLTQVLLNLLNNAAKYTPRDGRIEVVASVQGHEAVLAVRDTGIGIAADHQAGLFEMFSQVEPALERSQGGLGIGLALARGLVELHGGSIAVRSEGRGHGSEFVVRLPIAQGQIEPDALSPQAAAAEPGKLRVMVVDDNRDAAESLALMLELNGHEVTVCHDGRSALAAAPRCQPEVVLLDIGMPGMNGYEVAERLRQTDAGQQLLLVALTGWGQEEDKRRAVVAGFDHHLTKPVDPASLNAVLQAGELRRLHAGGAQGSRPTVTG